MKTPIYFFVLLLTILLGCSDQHTGTASETETSVSGLVVDASGSPVSNVALTVRPVSPNVALREGVNYIPELKSDEQGAYNFALKEVGQYLLRANHNEVGFAQRFNILSNQKSVQLQVDTLRELTDLAGLIYDKEGNLLPAKVFLNGTELQYESADGFFEFKKLPEFVFELSILPTDSNFLKKSLKVIPVGDTIKVYLQNKVPLEVISLDDFEDGDLIGSLNSITNGSEWWVGASGGEVELQVVPNPSACLVCETELNRVLQATLDVVDSAEFPFALFGINLSNGVSIGEDSTYVDLSNLEALSFLARGEGTLRVQFLTRTGLEITENNVHFIFDVQLSNRWQQFFVVSSDLKPFEFEGVSYPWNESSSEVWGISFMSTQDGSVWLDQIALEGVDLANFELP